MVDAKIIDVMETQKNCMDLLINVFINEIEKLNITNDDKLKKTKYIIQKIPEDLNLVMFLINEKSDPINASTILRTTFENMMYIFNVCLDEKIIDSFKIEPYKLRKNVNERYSELFDVNYFNVFIDEYYSFLCKIVHPTYVKEIFSYIHEDSDFYIAFSCLIEYLAGTLSYMYLCFLNKRLNQKQLTDDKESFELIAMNGVYIAIILTYTINESATLKKLFENFLEYNRDNIKKATQISNDLKEILPRMEKELANIINKH